MIIGENIPDPVSEPILKVEDLTIGFYTENGPLTVVEDVSFEIHKGRILGLVGESGCGKSVTAMSIMRLLPSPPSFIQKGRILFEGKDLLLRFLVSGSSPRSKPMPHA